MIPFERRNLMLAELAKNKVVSLAQFCHALGGVSESTVRRDLLSLEKEGLIETLRGGAARLIDGSFDTPVSSRKVLHAKEKELIARTAAELVHDGDIIYLDVGSTTIRMVKYLQKKRISIVTTDACIVQEIAGTDLNCMLVGGDIIKNTASLVGSLTDNTLRTLFFDKAFLGTYGFDLEAGFSSPDYREANKKRIVKQNSKEVYVLADNSKEGKRSLAKAFDLTECTLITDKLTDFVKEKTHYIIATP
jgi:DeoR family fructose operon transcriptional repressor